MEAQNLHFMGAEGPMKTKFTDGFNPTKTRAHSRMSNAPLLVTEPIRKKGVAAPAPVIVREVILSMPFFSSPRLAYYCGYKTTAMLWAVALKTIGNASSLR